VPPHATNPRPAAATAANANERLVMLEPAMVPSFPSVWCLPGAHLWCDAFCVLPTWCLWASPP
jgi:hypothetical protein